jgi:uncharacterized protein YjbI with pentapeptide repeats
MDRDEALRLLRGGMAGIAEWNRECKKRSDITLTTLLGADLRGTNLSGANLTRAKLRGVHLVGADLTRADLSGADLTGAKLAEADLSGADLTGADLAEADLSGAKLTRADLTGAKLPGAKLAEADLTGVILIRAKLAEADLTGAKLPRANLSGADLPRAKLPRVNLSLADLSRADLSGADLSGADLHWTDLTRADLSGTRLAESVCSETIFGCLDLSVAIGLEDVDHQGPSTLGTDTLFRSRGKIPEKFLRGCGVPDTLIKYLPALIGSMSSIQFYSCFISYSTKDEEFAQRLHARMVQAGLNIWFAPEDMEAGKKLHEQIDEAIRVHDKLMIVLSANSMGSEWVMTEIRKAQKAERKEGKRKLFPIRLVDLEAIRNWECFDADVGKDSAVEIREYHIPDVTKWKDHDAFEAAFKRLIDDLKMADEAGPRP